MKFLSRQEEFVLLAVHHLKDQATLKNIRRYLIDTTAKNWSVSSVYVPLDRLTEAGYLDTSHSKSQAKPGGKSRRFYTLSTEGIDGLQRILKLTRKVWGNQENRILGNS